MPESNEVDAPRRVVTSVETDSTTRWLLWAVVAVLLMLAAVIAYAFASGMTDSLFRTDTARTAQEKALIDTAAAIRKNPKEGGAYAVRAETLYRLGKKSEAYEVLTQGESAVGTETPAQLYVLRARTQLLNADENWAEAEKVGKRAMQASDEYLAVQGAKLANKKVTAIGANLQTRVSVDTAVQLAQAYMGQKKYKDAIVMYDYALKLDPLAADVVTLRGFAFLAAGDKAKAKADFQETLRFLPDDPDATRGLQESSN